MTTSPYTNVIPSSIIKAYAEAVGVNNLPEDALTLIAQDLEYRVRELLQDAHKFALHEHREKLLVDDVNAALRSRNLEPLYGYDSMESLSFRAVPNTSGLFYVPNEELDVDELLKSPLPPAPQPVTLTRHWLAINGIQPAIPENPTPADKHQDATETPVSTTLTRKELQEDAEIKALARHTLSKELQLLYDLLIDAIYGRTADDAEQHNNALKLVGEDAGIQPLLPYFVQAIAEKVSKHLDNEIKLNVSLALARALLSNEHIFVEPYLHQLMPPVLTCLLGRLGHISARCEAAAVLQLICGAYGDVYASLLPRVCKTLSAALLQGEAKEETVERGSRLGAIIGLTALGPNVLETLLIPSIDTIISAIGSDGDERRALEEAINVWTPNASSSEMAERVNKKLHRR